MIFEVFDMKSLALNLGSCDGEGRGSFAAASLGGRAIASLPPFNCRLEKLLSALSSMLIDDVFFKTDKGYYDEGFASSATTLSLSPAQPGAEEHAAATWC